MASYPVRLGQICDGSALCKELRVAEDLKVHVGVRAVAPQHLQPTTLVNHMTGHAFA